MKPTVAGRIVVMCLFVVMMFVFIKATNYIVDDQAFILMGIVFALLVVIHIVNMEIADVSFVHDYTILGLLIPMFYCVFKYIGFL